MTIDEILNKEILSEVLGFKITAVSLIVRNSINITGSTEKYTPNTMPYNIYELAHLCKTWAYKVDEYSIESGCDDCSGWVEIYDRDSCSDDEAIRYITAKTEPEAIFKATRWIYSKEKSDG